MTTKATTAGLGQLCMRKAAKGMGASSFRGKVTCRVSHMATGSVPRSSCCPGCVPLEAKSFQPFEFLAQTKGLAVSVFCFVFLFQFQLYPSMGME